MPPANPPVSGSPLSLKKAILGSQVSALRSQVRVIWYRYGCGENQVLNLYPNPNTRTWLQTAETRDLKVRVWSIEYGVSVE